MCEAISWPFSAAALKPSQSILFWVIRLNEPLKLYLSNKGIALIKWLKLPSSKEYVIAEGLNPCQGAISYFIGIFGDKSYIEIESCKLIKKVIRKNSFYPMDYKA